MLIRRNCIIYKSNLRIIYSLCLENGVTMTPKRWLLMLIFACLLLSLSLSLLLLLQIVVAECEKKKEQLWITKDFSVAAQVYTCTRLLILILYNYCSRSSTCNSITGLKKNLNSSLPLGQVAFKFCLPWAILCLLF